MHRFTNRRVPLSLAASALLIAGGVIAANPAAQAQGTIEGHKICKLDLAGATILVPPLGYTKMLGTAGKDNLKGGSGNDIIWGFAGKDELKGGGGDDILCGGADADELKGGSGRNHLHAGDEDDVVDEIKGGGGTDFVFADPTDKVKTGSGLDYMCTFEDVAVCTPLDD